MLKKFILATCVIFVFAQSSKSQVNTTSLTGAASAAAAEIKTEDFSYDQYFTDKTMRFDYFHNGNATEEKFSADEILNDGEWSGSKTILIDKLELGPYFFEIIDKETKKVIFSRGFASIFGEWQTTPEADNQWETFSESVRFPWPKNPVILMMKKRGKDNKFQDIWKMNIDPGSRAVNPAEIKPSHKIDVIQDKGPAVTKVDIVILGDGYSSSEMEKFKKDAKRLTEVLMSKEPFLSHKEDFNVRAVETPSAESGVWKPHPQVYKRTALSVHYGSFDSERYALTYDNKTVRNVASEVPYDFMVILINERTYGGGGIYNLYTTVSADNKFADYIMVHELGHHMAGLADEYYTSSVSYEQPKEIIEPWESNITAAKNKDQLKWKDLVDASTPVPTPWNKEEFDKFGYKIQKQRDSIRAVKAPETVMEDLFMKQLNQENKYFETEKFRDAVGAFEGAGYMQYGLFRPQIDCIMYTRHTKFCKVCQRSLVEVFNQYNR